MAVREDGSEGSRGRGVGEGDVVRGRRRGCCTREFLD